MYKSIFFRLFVKNEKKKTKWRCCGVMVSTLAFDQLFKRSQGHWFKAKLVSAFLCCFLRQETLLHVVSLHPGV